MKKQLHYNWGHEDDRQNDKEYIQSLVKKYEGYTIEELDELIKEAREEAEATM